ncbi:MAG: ABC transporter ATP-binding protein [Chloroflexota bacterium]
MLRLSAVSKNFGGLQVLDRLDLTVPEQGIFGLIGPNGAGKTTVFNLITGLLAPNDGAIEFHGRRLNGMAPHRITRCGVARTFQNIRLFKEMTLSENVLVARAAHPRSNALGMLLALRSYRAAERREAKAARELLAKVGLADKSEFIAGTLSYGEQRRLEIARALATDPKLLLLDEPAAGMNSAEKLLLMEEIVKLRESGLAMLIIEHDMRFIMGLCQQITVLNFGRVIAAGAPEEIRAHPEVVEAYLGRDETESGSIL